MRRSVIEHFWPQIDKLILHFRREQWDLFDKQHNELLKKNEKFTSITQRKIALYQALENYCKLFRPADVSPYKLIDDRINLAIGTSSSAIDDLAKYYAAKNKSIEIDNQIQDIRRRWVKIYYAVEPIYIAIYWNPEQYKLADYTLAQKRFDELKSIYIDCFETFCRISVIAAGIEGIIATKTASVPKAKGTLTLEQFDTMSNGSKSDILRKLAIADLFVPFIDHRLRNGIGHHAAHYDVIRDKIDFTIENRKGIQVFEISYIAFCDKVVNIYRQLELVSLYSNWLQVFI